MLQERIVAIRPDCLTGTAKLGQVKVRIMPNDGL
jgi:hypothetical protein